MQDNLTLTESTPLIAFSTVLAVWGISYARRIYARPFVRTWASVVLGVGIPLTFITVSIAYILWCCSELDDLWGVLFVPWLGIGIPALPMIYYQEKKHREQLNG